MVHGTDFGTAKKILQNEFSNLSLLDAGYYDRGNTPLLPPPAPPPSPPSPPAPPPGLIFAM